jgi:low temperature requirement protein LtrA
MGAKLQGVPEPVGEQEVTPLELFFDLVFVFAITQVSGFLSAQPSWTRFVQALALLAVLWFAWAGYAWLGNTTATDEGLIRIVLLAAAAATLVASLAVPRAFGRDGLIFGVAYFVVRALHIAAYLAVSREDAQLRGVVTRLASTILPAAVVLVVAGALHGAARDACWALALAIDYGGLAFRGVEGWRVEPKHFAERHGLIIIIALGESIVSLGLGASQLALSARVITGSLLGIAVAAALWWAYFDVVAMVAERRLRAAEPAAQVEMARDSYTYMHLPMVTGIVLFAVGVRRTLEGVDHRLHAVTAVALCGGVGLFFLAMSGFRRRNIGGWNRPRLVTCAALVALAPIALTLPSLVALALVALVAVGDIAYEVNRYAEARQRIRHGS